MIKSLLSVIQKNFRILWRSKLSTVMMILIPVLIILIASYSFNSFGVSGVGIGVYSESYSDLSEGILESFVLQNFIVEKYNSKEACIQGVKSGNSEICVEFPKDLNLQGSIEKVYVHVDHSRINLAYTLVNDIEKKISTKASELGTLMAQDLIDSVVQIKSYLPESKSQIASSKANLGEIAVKDISQDIDLIITELENAKETANNTNSEEKIAQAIIDLEEIKKTNSESSDELVDKRESVEGILNELSSNIGLIEGSVQGVNVLEAKRIVSPIEIEIQSINEESKNRDYLIPILLGLIALFVGLLLSASLVLKERKTKAYFRNFITPTSSIAFWLGVYLTCLVVVVLQFILIFLGMHFISGIDLINNVSEVSLLLLIGVSVFITIGMFLGYLLKSEETIIFASVFVGATMMFFSNTIFPIESISGILGSIVEYNPVVILDSALKKVILFDFGLKSVINEVYKLLGFFLAFSVLSYFMRRLSKNLM